MWPCTSPQLAICRKQILLSSLGAVGLAFSSCNNDSGTEYHWTEAPLPLVTHPGFRGSVGECRQLGAGHWPGVP